MEEKLLTSKEAWERFFNDLTKSDLWPKLSLEKKQYVRKTNRDVKADKCGSARLQKMFEEFAPGKYTLSEGWVVVSE